MSNPPTQPRPRLWNRTIMGWPYEYGVIRGTYRWLWDCPWSEVDRLYAATIQPHTRHVEIGPGNGYFVHRLPLTGPELDVHLLDLHPGPLRASAHRLARFTPTLHHRDALGPVPVPAGTVHTVALSMVLHCVPGESIHHKAAVFDHIAEVLAPGGWCIGATVLAHGSDLSARGRAGLRLLNARGVFSNRGDSRTDLEAVLRARFSEVDVAVRGAVALWQARKAPQ